MIVYKNIKKRNEISNAKVEMGKRKGREGSVGRAGRRVEDGQGGCDGTEKEKGTLKNRTG